MSIIPPPEASPGLDYPTSDGKPMAETDWHRELMIDLIQTLTAFYADQSTAYVSGNLLLFYEKGNRRRHVSPDVFVVFGVGKHQRGNYLLWEEGQSPGVVIELTSKSTRSEDQNKKKRLYQDVLKVREYFLFDPLGDYLAPPLQGYRLRGGLYQPIQARQGRLPSQQLGLHLERDGQALRLWNPAAGGWLPVPREASEAERRLRLQAEQRAAAEALARQEAEAKAARLRRMLEERGVRPEDLE